MLLFVGGKLKFFCLEDAEGLEIKDESKMGSIATDYYRKLFTSKGVGNLTHVLSRVEVSIIDSNNDLLLAP